eukprot:TRINITY_DN3261_c0_g5_i2.p3 TRINITY_DN3261_c0_g5~~TRINITY_DN3261_c0_g5_i2.p3  ORF type:complete len:118 (+),score=32.62 TRINITY_DN3261_c0_g5_i2:90-443(+)
MIRRPPRSTLSSSSAASDVYKRQYQRRVRGKDVGMASAAGEQDTPFREHPTSPEGIKSGQPFSRLQEHDHGGNLLQHMLKHYAPPCMPNPVVLWRCCECRVPVRGSVRDGEPRWTGP